MRVADIRKQFRALKTPILSRGVSTHTLEIVGAYFIADEASIFGKINATYIQREHQWYMTQSRNLADFPGGAPKVWLECADKDGFVNSNYGWCVYSKENGSQFDKVVAELLSSPHSRRAEIIYTRPSMWEEWNINGRTDFMCTNAVQYMVRDNALQVIVQMRSNDANIGYKNDYAWQKFVQTQIAKLLNVDCGHIIWQVGSLHLYERDWVLL